MRVEIRNDEPFGEMDFSELNTAIAPDPRNASGAAPKPPVCERDRSVTQDIAEVPIPVDVVRQNTTWLSMGQETSRSVALQRGADPAAVKPVGDAGEAHNAAMVFMRAQEFYRNRPEFMEGIAAAFERSVLEVPGFAARYFVRGTVTQEGIEAAARNSTAFGQGATPSPVAALGAGAVDLRQLRADAERVVNSDPEFGELMPEVREALVDAIVRAAESSPEFVESHCPKGRVTHETVRAAMRASADATQRNATSPAAASRREEERRRGESVLDHPFKGK